MERGFKHRGLYEPINNNKKKTDQIVLLDYNIIKVESTQLLQSCEKHLIIVVKLIGLIVGLFSAKKKKKKLIVKITLM